MQSKKILCLIIVLISHKLLTGQAFENHVIFQESFADNRNGWEVNKMEDSCYSSGISSDGKYICELPANNCKNWQWTWVSLPTNITSIIDSESNVELSFNWAVLKHQNSFRIGIMFDTHNITQECQGGDFRVIWLTGDAEHIYTTFLQTKDCNTGAEWSLQGRETENRTFNKIVLKKDNYNYTVFINGSNVLNFDYKGKLNLDNLNFGLGQYAFSEFRVTTSRFVVKAPIKTDASVSNVPKIWVLIAGIKNYINQKPLNYTDQDASAMYDFWTGINGGLIPYDQITLLSEKNATSQKILDSAQYLFSKASINDVIIIFLAGHGGVGHFAAYDGNLSYTDLNQIMDKSNARHKLFIIDACHSGSATSTEVLTTNGNRLSQNDALNLFYDALQKSGKRIGYLLACKASENSIEEPSLNHGLFTYFLIQGLFGMADTNHDHLITLQEIFDFVRLQVPAYDPSQTPEIKGNYDPETPIAVQSNR